MSYKNDVSLLGNLTKDPEAKTVATDKTVCNFTLAVNSGWGDNKRTDFVSCVAWGPKADVLSKYCKKGSKIGVKAEVMTRNYDDPQGNRRFITEFLVTDLDLQDSKPKESSQSEYIPEGPPPTDDNLPF